jgi:endonuclease III
MTRATDAHVARIERRLAVASGKQQVLTLHDAIGKLVDSE